MKNRGNNLSFKRKGREFKIQKFKDSKIQNSKFKIQHTSYLIPHSAFKIQDSRFKIQLTAQNQTAISFGFGTMTYDYDNDRFNQGLKL